MQWFINYFFTGKLAEKRRYNETESTTEDKDGDNSDNSSDQINDETCTWYKQCLIFPGEWPPETYTVFYQTII